MLETKCDLTSHVKMPLKINNWGKFGWHSSDIGVRACTPHWGFHQLASPRTFH